MRDKTTRHHGLNADQNQRGYLARFDELEIRVECFNELAYIDSAQRVASARVMNTAMLVPLADVTDIAAGELATGMSSFRTFHSRSRNCITPRIRIWHSSLS